MNRTLLIIALAFLVLGKTAHAQSAEKAETSQALADSDAKIARVQALMNALAKEGAVEINESNDVVLKRSFRDQLMSVDRVNTQTVKTGTVCD